MVIVNQTSLNVCSSQSLLAQSCRSVGSLVKPVLLGALLGALLSLNAPSQAAADPAVTAPDTAGPPTVAPSGSTPAAAAPPAAAETAGRRDPPSCQVVRFSDVGWTDVTSTTALVTQLLRSIGYSPTITVLSVPVTFASLQNNDSTCSWAIGCRRRKRDRGHYVQDGSIVVIGANLTGAKYTLAVPAYTYAAGLKDFKDIQHFGAELNDSIYGIEPGNDGNRHVLEMLKQNQFGLGGLQADRIQ